MSLITYFLFLSSKNPCIYVLRKFYAERNSLKKYSKTPAVQPSISGTSYSFTVAAPPQTASYFSQSSPAFFKLGGTPFQDNKARFVPPVSSSPTAFAAATPENYRAPNYWDTPTDTPFFVPSFPRRAHRKAVKAYPQAAETPLYHATIRRQTEKTARCTATRIVRP